MLINAIYIRVVVVFILQMNSRTRQHCINSWLYILRKSLPGYSIPDKLLEHKFNHQSGKCNVPYICTV